MGGSLKTARIRKFFFFWRTPAKVWSNLLDKNMQTLSQFKDKGTPDTKALAIWSRVPETALSPWDNFSERLYVKTVSLQAESKLTLHDYS